MARIAGLLHVATHTGAGARPISRDTMRSAISVGRYLLAHAQNVLGQMGASDPVLVDAKVVLTYLQGRKVTKISRRDLHQALRKGHEGRFRHADNLDAPLALLVERGWIRIRKQREGKGKGRTSVVIEVNPHGAPRAQKPQKAQKVEAAQTDDTPTRAIEPIEPIEATQVELGCTMTGESTVFGSVTSTAATQPSTEPTGYAAEFVRNAEEAAKRYRLDELDPDSPEWQKAYNSYVCELV
ncbi:MAG: DUF3987 domain-containing protein [Myxococcales bacterium]|nr:DUF3987 domain-containing protein [Myxococcales bacterium]